MASSGRVMKNLAGRPDEQHARVIPPVLISHQLVYGEWPIL